MNCILVCHLPEVPVHLHPVADLGTAPHIGAGDLALLLVHPHVAGEVDAGLEPDCH